VNRFGRLIRAYPAYPLLLPGLLWLGIFFFVPMYYLLLMSLREGTFETGFTLTYDWSNYSDVISSYGEQIVRSVKYAAVATIAAFAIAYPLAYVIAFRAGKWKNVLLLLVVAPFFTNYLIRTIAWATILNDNGPVTQTLDSIGVLSVFEALGWTTGSRLLATPLAVVAGITYNYLPFMILPLYVSLEKIDKRLLEASLDLYANRVKAFLRVTLPLSLPGVFAGTLLTFIPAVGDYINAELLGSTQTRMIGNIVQSRFLVLNDYPSAAALAFVLMAGILIFIITYARILGTEEVTG
jgi:spermidine/putrescine transport system permease protein